MSGGRRDLFIAHPPPCPDIQQLHLRIIKKEARASGEKLNSETEQEVWVLGKRWRCLSEGKELPQ